MNPAANEWKPSPSAASFTPGQGFQVSTPSPAPAPAQSAERQESNLSDMDESDPLWQIVLKICEGDREKAIKMINDPDSLAEYPEVEAVLAAGGGGDDDDDAMDTTDDAAEKDLAKDVEKMKIDEKSPKKEEVEEAEEVVDPASLKEGDPREHLNLVFIGKSRKKI